MSTEPAEVTDVTPVSFEVEEDTAEQAAQLADAFPFTLTKRCADGRVESDDYVYTCLRPKGGWWVKMMRVTQNGAAELDKLTLAEQVVVVEHFMQIMPRADRLRLQDKFEDSDSSWDYDMLVPVIKAAKERWFGFPTGPSAAPSRTSPSTGKSSTAKPRSAAQTRARSRKTGS
jgi:hypothetical protein